MRLRQGWLVIGGVAVIGTGMLLSLIVVGNGGGPVSGSVIRTFGPVTATRGPIVGTVAGVDFEEQFYVEQDRLAVEAFLAMEAARIAEEERRAAEAAAEAERVAAAQRAAQARVQRSVPVVVAEGPVVTDGDVWWRLALCECGGNPACNTGNGFYGTFQFLPSTWWSVGGSGLPSEHSYEEQKLRAQILQARSGWGQWPGCARILGLR